MKFVLWLVMSNSTAHALLPAVNGAAVPDGKAPWDFDLGFRRAEVIDRATPGGKRVARQTNESVRTLTGRLARRLGAWHVGAEIQVADRDRPDARATALSQSAVNAGWSTPSATTYLQLTLPVSRSAYEKEDNYQLNALGRGFFALGVGQSWHADFDSLHLFAGFELHHSFDRPFENRSNAGYLEPGYGFNWMFGAAHTVWSDWQYGFTFAQTYEDPVSVHGDRQSNGGSSQRFFQAEFGVTYAFAEAWSLGLSYADQTLMPAANSDLMRELGVTLVGHWD